MKRVWIANLELSGSHWLCGVLNQHPDLEVTANSFPCDMGEARHYPPLPEGMDAILIPCRDMTCHRLSVGRLGYNEGNEDRFTDEESVRTIIERIESDCIPVLFVSYEGLLIYRSTYLENILEWLGVEPFEFNAEFIDANRKYITP